MAKKKAKKKKKATRPATVDDALEALGAARGEPVVLDQRLLERILSRLEGIETGMAIQGNAIAGAIYKLEGQVGGRGSAEKVRAATRRALAITGGGGR